MKAVVTLLTSSTALLAGSYFCKGGCWLKPHFLSESKIHNRDYINGQVLVRDADKGYYYELVSDWDWDCPYPHDTDNSIIPSIHIIHISQFIDLGEARKTAECALMVGANVIVFRVDTITKQKTKIDIEDDETISD